MSLGCSPSARRYRNVFLVASAAYVVLVVLISWIVPIADLPNAIRIPAALSPVLPILVTMWAMGRTIEAQKDEFLRMIQVRGMLIATALVLAFATGWGFLQEYVGIGPFPAIIAFPIWCLAWMAGSAYVARRYR